MAVINLPMGVTARVHHPDGIVREMNPADLYAVADQPLIATVCGDAEAIGWGTTVCLYGALPKVRSYRQRSDRPAWDDAARTIRRDGVAYVQYEQRDHSEQHNHSSRPRWTAASVRTEGNQP